MQRVGRRVGHGPLARRSLQDEVYDAVLDMVLGGDVPLGVTLGIDGLAGRLGVSPTPVREALVRLEATGLVERTAMRGYRVVPPMDAAQIEELYEARLLVEVDAAVRAYERRDLVVAGLSASLSRHATLVRDIEAGGSDRRGGRVAFVRRFHDAEAGFHTVLGTCCRNRYLQEMIDKFGANVVRLPHLHLAAPGDVGAMLEEHAQILSAFATGSQDDVADAVRHHILLGRWRSLSEASSLPRPPSSTRSEQGPRASDPGR